MCYISARFDSPKFIQPKHFHLKRQASVFSNEKVCVAMRLVSFVLNRRAHTHNLYWNRTKNKREPKNKKEKKNAESEEKKTVPQTPDNVTEMAEHSFALWSTLHSHLHDIHIIYYASRFSFIYVLLQHTFDVFFFFFFFLFCSFLSILWPFILTHSLTHTPLAMWLFRVFIVASLCNVIRTS